MAGSASARPGRPQPGEHQALGEELQHQPAASRAQRLAQRHLARPRRTAGQQQVRQIDPATNQQQDDGRGEQASAVCVRPAISSRRTTTTGCGPRKSFAVTCRLNAAMDCRT